MVCLAVLRERRAGQIRGRVLGLVHSRGALCMSHLLVYGRMRSRGLEHLACLAASALGRGMVPVKFSRARPRAVDWPNPGPCAMAGP